jgi:glycosyltransferase involved in cell wall biosynthesis
MSVGLTSVVTDIPANRQLIEPGLNGFTVPFGDTAAITRALVQLIQDPKLRKSMGSVSRTRVIENYPTLRVVERYEQLFREILTT